MSSWCLQQADGLVQSFRLPALSSREILQFLWIGSSHWDLLSWVNTGHPNSPLIAELRHVTACFLFIMSPWAVVEPPLCSSPAVILPQLLPFFHHCSALSYLCIQGSVTAQPEEEPMGHRCSAGFYCPPGTIYMIPCPVGTFNSIDGDT